MTEVDFSDLVGKTISAIVNDDNEELKFATADGALYRMYHSQYCCETVVVEEIIGDLEDIAGSPILLAEVVTNSEEPRSEGAESFTRTFYKLSTIKGSVTIRWLGTSNGYYSECVDFVRVR